MFATIFGWLVGPIINGAVNLFTTLFGSAKNTKAGMDAQRVADDDATKKQAVAANKASDAVATETDTQVREDLKNDFRP